jgi:hypothetical protein
VDSKVSGSFGDLVGEKVALKVYRPRPGSGKASSRNRGNAVSLRLYGPFSQLVLEEGSWLSLQAVNQPRRDLRGPQDWPCRKLRLTVASQAGRRQSFAPSQGVRLSSSSVYRRGMDVRPSGLAFRLVLILPILHFVALFSLPVGAIH